MRDNKNLKVLAKEAKKRLKSGFWEKYKDEVLSSAVKAREEGVDASKVLDYFEAKTSFKKAESTDKFYEKVKDLLDQYGERGNVLSMLVDYSVYDASSYEKKQKYMLELSEKYRDALERYKREKSFSDN